MYESFFGMQARPFTLTPDTSFYYRCPGHQAALNVLTVALHDGEGFIKVTGEVGTGKTLLCRRLLNELGEDFVAAYLPNPLLEPQDLWSAIADELAIDVPQGLDTHRLSRAIAERLMALGAEGRRVVVCLDEAQAMPAHTLEALRLLTNLETEKRKLIQVVLFGQPELDRRLDDPQARQLRQRIVHAYRLRPLDRDGVAGYLAHRLSVAGYNGGALFTARAVRALYRASGGIPRLVNVLAHKALMIAYGRGERRIDLRHVRYAASDTESALSLRRWPLRPWAQRAAVLAGVAVAGGWYLWGAGG